MKTIKFNNADELVAYCIDNNIFAGQVYVDHTPYGDGERTLLWFYIDTDKELCTYLVSMEYIIKGVNYASTGVSWHRTYTGSFELVLPVKELRK